MKSLMKAMGIKFTEDYPDWYGIEGIKFIWVNTQSDPLIEYKGKRCSCYIIEDTMWQRWTYPDDKNYSEENAKDEKGFAQYMLDNADEVKELCELVLFGEE